MATLRKAERLKTTKKRVVGGISAVKHKRGTNQRSHVVRNLVRRAGVFIAPSERTFQSGVNFAFVLEGKDDLLFLPALGYVGGRPEVENIRSKVVADNMTEKEINQIADAVERRLNNRLTKLATKEDLKGLASKEDVGKLAIAVDGLRSLVEERLPSPPLGLNT